MAGTLIINARADWLPAGWLFDSVLDGIASRVATARPDLARSLRDARTEGGSGYLDMTDWSATLVAGVLEAAVTHRRRTQSAGARAFHDPSFFPAYLSHLDDLIEKLRRDPRIEVGSH